ncbi:MAG: hypothetical protein J1E62_04145 [Lachnospiraceae bacterium]|nr:hypothetical protein [Lachnospiraceae bacterium]
MGAKRGEYGYIRAKKKKTALFTVIYAAVAIGIYVLGLFLNHMSRQNIFTVIAVLGVLPTVKQIVGFIVIVPYASVSKEQYDKVCAVVPEGMELLTDLVITSPDKIMHLDYMAVGNKQVIALLGNGKQEISYVREYLSKGVANWGTGYKVKIVEQEKKFLRELSDVVPESAMSENEKEEEEHVRSYLMSLIV